MLCFYYVVKAIVRIMLFLFTDFQVEGREYIPGYGGIVVVANHLGNADPPVIGLSLGRKAVFMAKRELFRSRLGSFVISKFGAFPVHRGQRDRVSLRWAHQALAKGLALVIFPEGSRSKNAQLQPAFPGSAFIALRNSAPILPVGISGTEKLDSIGWLWRRPTVRVNFGRPFYLPVADSRRTKAELVELADSMMQRIAELLPPEYRGDYAERRD